MERSQCRPRARSVDYPCLAGLIDATEVSVSESAPQTRIDHSAGLGSGELSREPGVGKRQGWVLEDRVARVVEQRTEDQLPGRAALELLALTRCCLAVKRDKPSGAVAAVPSCSECESHSLPHCRAPYCAGGRAPRFGEADKSCCSIGTPRSPTCQTAVPMRPSRIASKMLR